MKIAGLSTYVPPRLLTNDDLEKLVDTTNEWILQRTGIRERHIVDPGVATSDLATEAAVGALQQAGITPDQIGFIVVGTTTPDTIFPSTACLLQHKIGAHQAWGFDLGAACSGFTYALVTGDADGGDGRARLRARRRRRRDVEHHRLHRSDDVRAVRGRRGRGGAGAGRGGRSAHHRLRRTRSTAAAGRPCACRPAAAGGPRRTRPWTSGCITSSRTVTPCSSSPSARARRFAAALLERNHVDPSQLDLFVSHQANRRIITAAAERLGLPEDKVVINLGPVRQHDRGDDPAGARRCGAPGAVEERRPGAARVGGRRVHGRGGTATVESLNLTIPIAYLPPLPCELRRDARAHGDVGARHVSARRAAADA